MWPERPPGASIDAPGVTETGGSGTIGALLGQSVFAVSRDNKRHRSYTLAFLVIALVSLGASLAGCGQSPGPGPTGPVPSPAAPVAASPATGPATDREANQLASLGVGIAASVAASPAVGLAASPAARQVASPVVSPTMSLLASPVATASPMPLLGAPRYGIIADPANPGHLEAVRAAGAKLTVLTVSWRDIEPNSTTPAQFDWSKYDARFEAVRQAGLTPLVIIAGNPAWVWPADASGIIRLDRLADFGEFVSALVARYRTYTTYWSFYHQPDCNGPVAPEVLSSCWGNAGVAYAYMLQTVYPYLKQADPNGLVIFGGVAFDNFQPDNAYSRSFLDDALAAGAGNAFDVFNFHYYPAFRQVWTPLGIDVTGKARFLRTTLQRYGIDKPFILSEIGVGSRGSGESEELQARYVAQAHARSLAAGIEMIFWYDLVDSGSSAFGLTNERLEARPSYTAYQTFIQMVGDRPFRRTLSAGELGTESLEGYEFGESADRRLLVVWS